MNYDTMSVHDLLLEAARDGMQGFLHDAVPDLCELPEIEAAIRRAVIREASVGVGTVKRVGQLPLPDAPMMFVPWETKDGDYDLIPIQRRPHESQL